MKSTIVIIGIASLLLLAFFAVKKPATQGQPTEFNQIILHNDNSQLPVWHPQYQTARAVSFIGEDPAVDELNDVQCPIPMKDRVKNYTGIQCVFASLECIGRWADCKLLTEPPITSRPDCKSYSSPSDASAKLKRLGVRFEQSYGNRAGGVALIKRAMSEGRGTLFGVPGHAMVLVHYDEDKGMVKYINNSNYKLPIQTMTMAEFNRRWDTWVIVIYAEPDLFPAKAGRDLPNMIRIIDQNNPQGQYKNYIPLPQK